MRKRLLRLLGSLLLVAVLGMAWAAWRAAAVPEWVQAQAHGASEAEPAPGGFAGALGNLLGIDLSGAGKLLWLVQELVNTGHVELDADALTEISTTALSGNRNGRALLAASTGLQARIGGGRVEMGGLLDLGKVDLAQLDDETRPVAERLLRLAPFVQSREIYFGLDARPQVLAGDLFLGDGASVHLGRLALPGWLSRALGIDQLLREKLTLDLQVIELSDASVVEDRVVIEGTLTAPIR